MWCSKMKGPLDGGRTALDSDSGSVQRPHRVVASTENRNRVVKLRVWVEPWLNFLGVPLPNLVTSGPEHMDQ